MQVGLDQQDDPRDDHRQRAADPPGDVLGDGIGRVADRLSLAHGQDESCRDELVNLALDVVLEQPSPQVIAERLQQRVEEGLGVSLDNLTHVDCLADLIDEHLDLVERAPFEAPLQEDALDVIHQRVDHVCATARANSPIALSTAASKSLRRWTDSPRRAAQAIS